VAISVVLKDEAGKVLARMLRPYVPLVSGGDLLEYPMLSHIDPYGNTIYNRGQMRTLRTELGRFTDSVELSGESSEMVQQLLAICAKGLERPHRYLWFVGD
jgi:hypothetical protein